MTRPKRTIIDPAAFAAGAIARQTAVDGGYETDELSPLHELVDALVARLPEPERSTLQGLGAGCSAAELGVMFGQDPEFLRATGRDPGPVHRRTVTRWRDRGAARVLSWLEASSWNTAVRHARQGSS